MSRNRFLKRNKRIRLKDKKIIQKTVFTIAIFFLVLILIVWGLHNQNIRITNIYIEGSNAVLDKDIKERVLMNIDNKYLWLFPKDNIFIYPKARIKKDILTTFKRVYYIKVNTIDLTSIVVTIKERDPYAIWCGESISDNENAISDTCFFMDSTGFIFARAPNFSDNVYLTIYGVLQNISQSSNTFDNPIGKRFLEEKYFTHLMLLRDTLSNEEIDAVYLTSQDDGDFQVYIATGGKLIFNKKQDIEKIFRDLISAVEAKEVDGMNVWENLEYIDLRFDNKVIFKFLM